MRYFDIFDHRILSEGRIYRVDVSYPQPVIVVSNPSPPQSRNLIKGIAAQHEAIYLRGLMYDKTVYIWDGYLLTHDDVRYALLPDVPTWSDDLTAFEVSNYTVTGVAQIAKHPARCRVLKPGYPNPEASSFVQNIIVALDALG